MKTRSYSEEEIKGLVEAFGHPIIATRNETIVAVNEAYLRELGYAREKLEGRPFVELLPSEERRWLLEWRDLKAQGVLTPRGPHSVLTFAGDGRLVRMEVGLSYLTAENGGAFTLASCFRVTREEQTFQLTETLVKISTSLISQRNEEAVRRATIEGLAQGGFPAAFYRISDKNLTLVYGAESGRDFAYAMDSVTTGKPAFARAPNGFAPSEVFLSIGPPRSEHEVLVVTGNHTVHDIAVWSLFSQVITAALTNAKLHGESSRQLNESRMLLQLARTTTATLELETILDVACDSLVKLLDMSNCFIMLYEESTRMLHGAASSSPHREFIRSFTISIDDPQSAASRTARERRIVAVEDVSNSPGLFKPSLASRFRQTAIIGIPLLSREQLIGVVILGDGRGPRQFAPSWLELAQATVGQLTLSIANARLYESLRKSYSELEETRAEGVKRERLAALGELAAIVAHEVRNPLGVIFNAVSSLRRPQPRADNQLLLDIISEESDRLNQITKELLNFARPAHLSIQPEDLAPVIEESMDAAKQQIEASGKGSVGVDLQIESSLPRVQLDRRLIRQALVNVASNALQATPTSGTVRVSAKRQHWKNGDWVRIDLADQGPGIPSHMAQRIFEPFFTTKASGTGLGLAVVKRIIEDHHGEVEVTSIQGRGATFTLWLPVRLDNPGSQ